MGWKRGPGRVGSPKEQIKNRLSQKLETDRDSRSEDYYTMRLDNLKKKCKGRNLSSRKYFIILFHCSFLKYLNYNVSNWSCRCLSHMWEMAVINQQFWWAISLTPILKISQHLRVLETSNLKMCFVPRNYLNLLSSNFDFWFKKTSISIMDKLMNAS